MAELEMIRCPQCLTDGQAPADLPRMQCPVCRAISSRQHCPLCGGGHLVLDGTDTITCPVHQTTVHLDGSPVGATPAAPVAPEPPAAPTMAPPPAMPPPVAAPAPEPAAGGWSTGAPAVPPSAIPGAVDPSGPPPAYVAGEPAASSGSRFPKFLVPAIVAAVVVIAAVVIGIFVLSGDDSTDPASIPDAVKKELDANPSQVANACAQVQVFGPSREQLQQMLESLPDAQQQSLLDTLRDQGERESWLPEGAEAWTFADLQAGLLALYDECTRRGLSN